MSDTQTTTVTPTLQTQLAAAFERVGIDVGLLQKYVGNGNRLSEIGQSDIISALVELKNSGGGVTPELLDIILMNAFTGVLGELGFSYLPGYEAAKSQAKNPDQ